MLFRIKRNDLPSPEETCRKLKGSHDIKEANLKGLHTV
jgi:hypothetical protein